MNNQIKTYFIPNNPNILKGQIYTLYINNNTNLDLSSIINAKKITIPSEENQEKSSIIISQNDYTKLLELNNKAYQLTNQRTNDIQKFLNEDAKIIAELTKINTERQQLIKTLTGGKENSQ